jgi:hypothetical protein
MFLYFFFFFIIGDRERELFVLLVESVIAIIGLIGVIKENLVVVLIYALTFNFSYSVHIFSGNYLPAIYPFLMFWLNYLYVFLIYKKMKIARADEQEKNGHYFNCSERVLLNI